MTQALYRKWRPKKWEEVVGQEHVVQTLQNAITGDRVGHAYLFSGPRGTGKTTVARLLAKAVNCQSEDLGVRPCNICTNCTAVNENRFLDLIEIDAASNTSVDDVRDLRDKIYFIPSQGKYKIYIIDEVHMLSKSAFNALLKTLEEPPPHAIFILATTEIHNIPATVLSRCQRHEFRRVPLRDIVEQLQRIADGENIAIAPEALTFIARQATGSFRDAISLLDQLASTGQKITLDMTQTVLGTATSQSVLMLIEAILDRQPAAGLEGIHEALDSGADPRNMARNIVDYLRALLLFQMGNAKQVEETDEIKKHMVAHAGAFSTSEILRMMRAFNNVAVNQRVDWQPALGLELALAEVLEPPHNNHESVNKKLPSITLHAPMQSITTPPPTTVPALDMEPENESKVESQSPTEKSTSHDVSLTVVVQAWKQIRMVIKPNYPVLDGLLNSCKPLQVKDGVLTLGFETDIVLSKMNKKEHLDVTRKAITQVLGVDMMVQCIVAKIKSKIPPNIDQNSRVAAALQAGGEIVDIQE
jgi:DNA polymerase-3 subunit gamma/tau